MTTFRLKMKNGDSVYLESTLEKIIMLYEMGMIQRAWYSDGSEVIA